MHNNDNAAENGREKEPKLKRRQLARLMLEEGIPPFFPTQYLLGICFGHRVQLSSLRQVQCHSPALQNSGGSRALYVKTGAYQQECEMPTRSPGLHLPNIPRNHTIRHRPIPDPARPGSAGTWRHHLPMINDRSCAFTASPCSVWAYSSASLMRIRCRTAASLVSIIIDSRNDMLFSTSM